MLIKTILELLAENKITVNQAESMINEVISLKNKQKDYNYPSPYSPNQPLFGNPTLDDYNTVSSQLELFNEKVEIENVYDHGHIQIVYLNGNLKLPDGRIITKDQEEYDYKGKTFKNPMYKL